MAAIATLTRENDTIVRLLKPFDCFVFGDLVRSTHVCFLVLTLADIETGSAENDVEVHAVDTDRWIVFDT